MANIAAHWTKLASSSHLRRSSHLLSANASTIWIFGGELLPRQPVGNGVDLVNVDAESEGINSSHDDINNVASLQVHSS